MNPRDTVKNASGAWVQIFEAGTHTDSSGKTGVFSQSDLDDAVSAFEATKDKYKPVLRVGSHAVGTAPGGGQVVALRRSGDYLEAQFETAPVVAEAIRNKMYTGLSSGLRFSRKVGDKTYRMFLDHVALLGHKLPAIKGLNGSSGLAALFDDAEGGEVSVITLPIRGFSTTEDDDMDVKEQLLEAQSKNRELQDKLEKRDGEFSEAEKAGEKTVEDLNAKHKKELDAANEKVKEFEEAAFKSEVEAVADTAVREGKLAPKNRDEQVAFGMSLRSANFSEGDAKPLEMWKKGWKDAPKIMEFEETATNGGEGEEGQTKAEAQFEEGADWAEKYGRNSTKDD